MTSKRKIAVFTQEKPDDCVICTEKMNENDPLNCGHWIHYTCIQKQFKAECPVCRAPLDINVKGSRPSDESLNILRVVGDVVERWFDGNDVEGNEVEGNEVEGNEVEGNEVEDNPDRPLTRVQEVLLYRYSFVPRMLFRVVRHEVTDHNVEDHNVEDHEVEDHEVEDHEVEDHEVEDGPVNEEDYDEENPSGDSVYYD